MTHKQLLNIMFFQALIPITIQSLPAAFLFVAANVIKFDSTLLSFPSTVFFAAIGGANAASVLWIIKSYRREVSKIFCSKVWKNNNASVQSTNELQKNSLFRITR